MKTYNKINIINPFLILIQRKYHMIVILTEMFVLFRKKQFLPTPDGDEWKIDLIFGPAFFAWAIF